MDVTPQLLHEIEFREAKRGGYDTRDVDDFLEKLAVGVEQLLAQVRDARQRAESLEARAAEAERRAASTSDADETLKRTLVLAQRTADAAIKEAEEQAARTLSAAQEEANQLLGEAREASMRARSQAEAEARRAQEEAEAQVLAELRALEGARDALRVDVELLEEHLETQRERVRSTLHELQRLLDDPAALRSAEVPPLSDVALPAQPSPVRPIEATPLPDDAWDAREQAIDEPELHTQPIGAIDLDDRGDEDDYLAELRRAMADDRPLGAPDDHDVAALFESSAERPERSRFGRRR